MNIEEFRVNGKNVIDYICKYLDTIEKRSVIPNVSPGYLSDLMPDEAPKRSEDWSDIMNDMERLIMPGITHWQHPRFHAYFPAGNSFPSILGDMLSDAIGCIGFSWAASPACTELEMIMLDWLAKMMNLPKVFMHSENLGGGGVLQGSASDCILVTMLSARHQKIKQIKTKIPIKAHLDQDKLRSIEGAILTKLVGYCSTLAHSSVEKAGMISFVKIHQLEIDDDYALRGATLEAAIKCDIENKLIPFFVCATLGTTACCSFDNIQEIGDICRKYNIWLHVDAAYAGSSFICPEYQIYLKGIENVDSLNFNPNKFMLVNFDCSILWVRCSNLITDSMIVDPVYLQHKHSSKAVDFRHWGIPLSRRFRALKLWFVIRAYGVEGLQSYIRNHINLASKFASLVKSNDCFEIVGKQVLGLVCFRLKANSYYLFLAKQELNSINQCLIRTINESGKLHMTPSVVKDKYILRFCVCKEHAGIEDIQIAWDIIKSVADDILKAQLGLKQWKYHMSRADVHNKDAIHSLAEKLVISVLSPQTLKNCLDGNEKKEFCYGVNSQQTPFKKPSHRATSEDIVAGIKKKSDSRDEDDDLPNIDLYIHDNAILEEEKMNHEVFVCENDLGIGVDKHSSLTQLRRQTLLKMISDPAAYNRNFFKSLCFCNDFKKEMIPSPESCMEKHQKPLFNNQFSRSEYTSTSRCPSTDEEN